MFEASLVESSGQLRSKSSRYVWVTATFNAAVLLVLTLIPLLHPEALPKAAMTAMLTAPPPPPSPAPRPATVVKAAKATASLEALSAPTHIPTKIDTSHEDPPPSVSGTGVVGMSVAGNNAAGAADALGLGAPPPVVKVAQPKASAPVPVSSGVIAGSRLSGSNPVYPAIAKAAHVSGAVVLRAIISKTGAIKSLLVISGPEMLRASAVAAVQDWKYKPYLLNGEPTEVDTTITVNFSFGT